jgi:protein involved in polysaccharide export with SLBB domain
MRRLFLAFAVLAALILTSVPLFAQRVSKSPQPKPRVVQSAVQRDLQRNAVLCDAVRVRLPQGTDLNSAAGGFRRLELFVATVNASNNLGIPFIELKRRIVNDGMTLGQAIQDIRPASKYWSEARRAEEDAAATIRTTESVTLAAEKKPSR